VDTAALSADMKVKVGTGTKGMEVKVNMGAISLGTETKAKDRTRVRRVSSCVSFLSTLIIYYLPSRFRFWWRRLHREG